MERARLARDRLEGCVIPGRYDRGRTPITCPGCNRSCGPGLGCIYCKNVRAYWHIVQREYPDLSREHCILIGSFVAGMVEAYHTERGRNRRPSKSEYDKAVDLAGGIVKSIGFLHAKEGKGLNQ